MRGLLVTAGLLAVAGCASPQKDARYMAGHARAQADLKMADGTDVGKAIA
ncbi:MAG: hypothetical protein IH998_10820, partial [Proteobacteria bacterium]|nr:hypothetical protein [Pseudomonadota bacterium]